MKSAGRKSQIQKTFVVMYQRNNCYHSLEYLVISTIRFKAENSRFLNSFLPSLHQEIYSIFSAICANFDEPLKKVIILCNSDWSNNDHVIDESFAIGAKLKLI